MTIEFTPASRTTTDTNPVRTVTTTSSETCLNKAIEGKDSKVSKDNKATEKREKTRKALVTAARELVFERGHDKISIQDMTERAGVGLGTFYNYFETKHQVFEAVLEEMREKFQSEMENLRAPLKDPATLVALTLQHCFQQALDNEEWKTFVVYSGLPGEHLLLQDPEQCLADIRLGADRGRFNVDDVHFAADMITGMTHHITREIKRGRMSRSAIKDATRYILRMLGLPDLVAKALIQTPLPPVSASKRNLDPNRHVILPHTASYTSA